MKHQKTAATEDPVLPCCGRLASDHCKNPLDLAQATVRVAELGHLGYTESIVVDDLRIRVEKLEVKIRELETANVRLRVQP